jgi:hypothetical protein
MTTSLIIKDTRPTKDFTIITQIGLKTVNLALAHKDAIEARLPGAIDSLILNLDAVGVVVPGALQARNEARAATAAQNAQVEKGYLQVQAIRETIRTSGAPKDVQRAYGVGQRTASDRVASVKAALLQITKRASDEPEEAATFGIIAEDVAAMTALVNALMGSNSTQEKKRADAPLTTKERNRTGNRILQTVGLILGAGRIAFANNPEVRASFEALAPKRKRKVAPKPKAAKPALPVKPAEPTKPAEPSVIAEPTKPAEPTIIAEPTKPAEPVKPPEGTTTSVPSPAAPTAVS